MEKMLMTQALDERDLLVKKINRKIEKASFIDVTSSNMQTVVFGKIDKTEFEKNAQSALDSIADLIRRYSSLDAAIIKSNAENQITVKTNNGELTVSVAVAISMRNRLRDTSRTSETNFAGKMVAKLMDEYDKASDVVTTRNSALVEKADIMRNNILGKDSKKEDTPLAVVDEYVASNTAKLCDPINVLEAVEQITDERATLLRDLDTQIKVSNATTTIEF